MIRARLLSSYARALCRRNFAIFCGDSLHCGPVSPETEAAALFGGNKLARERCVDFADLVIAIGSTTSRARQDIYVPD
jgi:hypothetical protein